MIQANELRIGNWYNQFGNYHKADWATIKELSDAPKDQLWCKPIPLTEEILLKCGFEAYNEIHFYKSLNPTDNWKNEETILELRVSLHKGDTPTVFFYHKIRREVKYLHQLQNLYFALTNQELEINL